MGRQARALGGAGNDVPFAAVYLRRHDADGLLYTDGLVERRRRPLTAGIAAVAAALQDGHGLPAKDLASQVMAALAPSSG